MGRMLSRKEIAQRIMQLPPRQRREAAALALKAYGPAHSAQRIRPHIEYQDRPIEWITEKLGIPERTLRWSINPGYDAHSWDGTEDPLIRVAETLVAGEDVGVESATGTGKSYVLALLTLWFLACHEDARVYSYAPKEDQLRLYMWTEIRSLWPLFQALFPSASLTDLRLRMDGRSDKWGAVGYAVQVRSGEKSATGAQGAHAPHMLLITEETPGIDASVMAALENTATAPHNLRLAVGNPDSEHDTLHQFCLSPGVKHIRISALDHPNVVCSDPNIVPGAVSQKAITHRRHRYGVDDRMYLSRVRGISPAEAENSLIRRVWCDEAVARYSDATYRVGLPALGVDVANSEGGDKAALAYGLGACLLELDSFPCPDANALGRMVRLRARLEGVDERHVGVDSVGVGAGTVNEMKRLGMLVQSLNGGARPEVRVELPNEDEEDERPILPEEQFNNLRSQMWWQMRLDLQHGKIALPDDEELLRDLTVPTWETSKGKVTVEPKEKIKARLGRSPDKGDAAVYWNWVRNRNRLPKAEENEHVDAWSAEALAHEADIRRRSRPPRGRKGPDAYYPELGGVI